MNLYLVSSLILAFCSRPLFFLIVLSFPYRFLCGASSTVLSLFSVFPTVTKLCTLSGIIISAISRLPRRILHRLGVFCLSSPRSNRGLSNTGTEHHEQSSAPFNSSYDSDAEGAWGIPITLLDTAFCVHLYETTSRRKSLRQSVMCHLCRHHTFLNLNSKQDLDLQLSHPCEKLKPPVKANHQSPNCPPCHAHHIPSK